LLIDGRLLDRRRKQICLAAKKVDQVMVVPGVVVGDHDAGKAAILTHYPMAQFSYSKPAFF
jgi:hypothetical protein